MKYLAKVVLVLVAMFAGFAAGYWLARELMSWVCMVLAQEPMSNAELYSEFRNSLPVFLGSLLLGGAAGFGVGSFVEKLLNKYGFGGLLTSADEALQKTALNLRLKAVLVEEGQEPQQAELFACKVSAVRLARLFKGEAGEQLLLKHPALAGVQLFLNRPQVGPYDGSDEATPIRVCLRNGRETLHAFESSSPGIYKRPEGKDVAFCRFPLTYVGVEEEVDATLTVDGDARVMAEIFLAS